MAPPALTFRRVRLPAVGLLFVLALLPQRFCFYGPPLYSIAMTFLSPVSAPLASFSSQVRQRTERPIPEGIDVEGLSAEQREKLERIGEEMRSKDTRIIVMEQRIEELERINAELQGLERRLGDSYLFRRAAVTGLGSDGTIQTLRISRGTRDGLRVGMAVVEGANLIGRIIQSDATGSTVKPLTAKDNLLEVMLTPPQLPPDGLPTDRRRTCLLTPEGPRLLTADDVDRSIPVEVGDYARLDDDASDTPWPAAVQGMIVGRVVLAEPDPDDPLRKRVHVRPLLSPYYLDEVTVIVPRSMYDSPDAAEAGEGRS